MGTCSNQRREFLPPMPTGERPKAQWLNQFDIKTPEMACSYSYQITNVCINRTCNAVALFCDNSNCRSCTKYHSNCGHIKLSAITTLMHKRAELQRDLAMKLEEIQNKIFYAIQKKKNDLLSDFFSSGFQDKYLDFVQSIYFGKKKMAFKGELTQEFYWKLRQSNSRLANTEEEITKFYKRELERAVTPIVALKRDVLAEYLCKAKVMTTETERSLTKSQMKNLSQFKIDSVIIHKSREQKIKFIYESLDFPKELKLLFRASENGFKAANFHAACDNKSHTFTLVETEFNKVLGGYTPLTWNECKGYGHDQESAGFLISINLFQKFRLIKPQKAIQCNPQYGPVFGSGADLAVSDECDKNLKSCLNFPFSYNYKNPYKFDQQTWTALCGAPEGKSFKVREYEVFSVIW